jgi:hypothetical protein
MTATLTHTTATLARSVPKSPRKSPLQAARAASPLKRMLLALADWSALLADAQEEARKAQKRYPFILE